ncbi:unnamed protein product [Ostreobium quekettii]|uniref:Uncharacterized protein n=1 Tax=Ostreobium quekettii TaxID=121088 RepID=A0A8S1J8M6_9CHLO|nr:unnamed protein product [Ostreobium quekettii]
MSSNPRATLAPFSPLCVFLDPKRGGTADSLLGTMPLRRRRCGFVQGANFSGESSSYGSDDFIVDDSDATASEPFQDTTGGAWRRIEDRLPSYGCKSGTISSGGKKTPASKRKGRHLQKCGQHVEDSLEDSIGEVVDVSPRRKRRAILDDFEDEDAEVAVGTVALESKQAQSGGRNLRPRTGRNKRQGTNAQLSKDEKGYGYTPKKATQQVASEFGSHASQYNLRSHKKRSWDNLIGSQTNGTRNTDAFRSDQAPSSPVDEVTSGQELKEDLPSRSRKVFGDAGGDGCDTPLEPPCVREEEKCQLGTENAGVGSKAGHRGVGRKRKLVSAGNAAVLKESSLEDDLRRPCCGQSSDVGLHCLSEEQAHKHLQTRKQCIELTDSEEDAGCLDLGSAGVEENTSCAVAPAKPRRHAKSAPRTIGFLERIAQHRTQVLHSSTSPSDSNDGGEVGCNVFPSLLCWPFQPCVHCDLDIMYE